MAGYRAVGCGGRWPGGLGGSGGFGMAHEGHGICGMNEVFEIFVSHIICYYVCFDLNV